MFADWGHPVESRGLASLCFRNDEKGETGNDSYISVWVISTALPI